MKKKVRVKLSGLKPGECFRLTCNGPIYMKDNDDGGQVILGKGVGRLCNYYFEPAKLVYPAKVKIVEVK